MTHLRQWTLLSSWTRTVIAAAVAAWHYIRGWISRLPWDIVLTRTKAVVEIAAILLSGYWAYTHFLIGEAPSLEPSFRITGSLEWSNVTDTDCLANYKIEITNIGKTSIEVTGVQLQAWISDRSSFEGPIKFIESDNLKVGEPYNFPYKQELATHYAPGASDHATFNFTLKRAPGKIVLFQVSFPSLEGYGGTQSWYDYQWDWVCGELSGAKT